MTSQASSTKLNNNSPFWVNFTNCFKGTMAFPALVFGFLAFIYPLTSLVSIRQNISQGIIDNPAYNIAKEFKFLLSDPNSLFMFAMIIPYLLLIAGVLLGVSKFKFMTRKNSVNVYFSLGITRTNLFASTYLAGAAQLFLAVAVPMLSVFFINLGYFGYSKELMLSILGLALGYFATILFAFTVASIVTSAVGTYAEAAFYSLILVLLPNIAFACINQLMTLFLLGNEYVLGESYITGNLGIKAPSLVQRFAYLVPSDFMGSSITEYSVLDEKGMMIIANYGMNESLKWVAPNFVRPLGWIATSLAGFVGGLFVMNKRRAEYAGFFGANRVVNNIITFIISFAAACVSSQIFLQFLPRTASIMLAIVVFIVVYLIANIIMIRKVKVFVKELVKLPIHVCVGLVICLFFVTGLFGYSTKQPNISDIEKIDISIPDGSIIGLSSSSGSSSEGKVSFSNMQGHLKDITSKNDIKHVLALHKAIINDGKLNFSNKELANSPDDSIYGNVYIKYTLKDGKSITRYYEHIKVSTLVKLLDIENTDRYDNIIDSIFTQPINKKDADIINSIKQVIQGKETMIYLLPKNLDIRNNAELTEAQRKELLTCLAKDLKEQSASDRYLPKSEFLGVLSFVNTSVQTQDSYEKNGVVVSSQHNPDENVINELTADMLTSISNNGYGSPQYLLSITSDMKNTIKFLEDNSLLKYFDNESKIVSAEVINRKIFSLDNPWEMSYNHAVSYQFVGGRTTKEILKDSEEYSTAFKHSFKSSDAETISLLQRNSYYNYYAPTGGYFVRFALDNGDKTVMFVPENKIPQHIKDSIDKIASDYEKEREVRTNY